MNRSGRGWTVDFAIALRETESRDDNLEGIPVFLALEDLRARPAAPGRRGDRRAELGHGYLQQQVAGREEPTLDDVATVFRILGACHFDEPA